MATVPHRMPGRRRLRLEFKVLRHLVLVYGRQPIWQNVMSSTMKIARLSALLGTVVLLVSCQTSQVDAPPADPFQAKLDASVLDAAKASERRGDFATATAYYRSAYDSDPKNLEKALGLARTLRRASRSREAIIIAERSLEIHKRNPHLMSEMGKSQLAENDTLAAIDTLSRAGALLPENWEIQSALGIGHDRVALYDLAARHYEKALKLAPSNAVVLNNYALSLAQDGKLEKAIKLLERASAMPESNAQIRQNLALLYAAQGDLKAAERLVKRDLKPEIAAENLEYYRRLATGESGRIPPLQPSNTTPTRPESRLQGTAPSGPAASAAIGNTSDRLPAQAVTPVTSIKMTAVPATTSDWDNASSGSQSESSSGESLETSSSAESMGRGVAPIAASNQRPAAIVSEPRPQAELPRVSPASALPNDASSADVASSSSARAIDRERNFRQATFAATSAREVDQRLTAIEVEKETVPAIASLAMPSQVHPDRASSRDQDDLQGDGSSSPADVDSRADVSALPSLTTADDKESGTSSPVSSVSPDVTIGEASAAGNRLTATNEFGSVQGVDRDNQEAILRAALTTTDEKSATTTTPVAEDKPELLTIEKTSPPGGKATTSDTGKKSAYRVQLGSYRSEAAANAGIAILRSAHDDILGDLNLGIKAVTLPEIGDYFRVVTAPLPSRVAAAEICRELQSREVNCLVWRRR